MKKTVVFEFPDDFEFPPEFIDRVCCKRKGMYEPNVYCPFYVSDDEYAPYCMLTGGEDGKACPFYHGAGTVNYDDC